MPRAKTVIPEVRSDVEADVLGEGLITVPLADIAYGFDGVTDCPYITYQELVSGGLQNALPVLFRREHPAGFVLLRILVA
jgi:hypothetical protein